MEKKILVNIANNSSNGLGIGTIKEKEISNELCSLILNELKINTEIDGNYISITNPNPNIITLTPLIHSRNIALSICFNCFPIESARGTEAIVPFKSTHVERELAKILVDNISACLVTKNRGVRTEVTSFKQEPLFLISNYENISLKICFITNKADLLMYADKKRILAKIIAKCIYHYVSE